MLPGYPALGWATTQVYPARVTQQGNSSPFRISKDLKTFQRVANPLGPLKLFNGRV